jgi:isoleucyl-tRNA synthetase
LREEGVARELVNKIQNLRKDSGLNVTDRINLQISENKMLMKPVENYKNYICTQTLTEKIEFSTILNVEDMETNTVEIDENTTVYIKISKVD